MFDWFRAIHIIAVIAWMAAQLMYPRLLAYRLEAVGNPGFEKAMDVAAHRLRMVILNPAIILSWLMGLALFGQNWSYYIGQPWFWGKILLVTGLSGLHGYLADPVRMSHGCSWRFFGGFLALTRRFLILG